MNEYAPIGTSEAAAENRQVSVTRSEEHLQTTIHQVPVSTARLQKFILTEQKTFTVDVRREEVRLTVEPISDVGSATVLPGQPDEIEIVLYEERVTITKELVPVERVKLTKKLITVHQPITDTVQKERIEILTDPTTSTPTSQAR